jgi:hypothetical protein
MQELAAKKGGLCLSREYVNVKTHLEWQCAEGHRWKAKPNNIQQGKWCRKCAIDARLQEHRKTTLQRCKELASAKGGLCESTIFENNKSPLLWRCSVGHQFSMPLSYIDRGSWCPDCRQQST